MDSADCIECDRAVRERQEGLQCDGCDRWQHRTCKTGISRRIYRATVRGELDGLQTWYCNYCPRPGMGPATPTLRQEPATPTSRQEPATPTLRQEPAVPTTTEDPIMPVLTEELVVATRERQVSRQVMTPGRSPSPRHGCPIWTELSPSSSSSSSSDESEVEKPSRPLFLPLCPRKFKWNPRVLVPAPDATFIVDRNDDVDMSDDESPRTMDKAFIEDSDSEDDSFWFPSMRSTDQYHDDDEVRYEILEKGTALGHPKLVSTDGYSYTVRKSTARTTTWRCSVRNRHVQCTATVIQRGESFNRGLSNHVHLGQPLQARTLRIKSKVRSRAITHRHLSAADILSDIFREEPDTRCFHEPNYLIRIIKRQRSKMGLQH